MRVPHEITQDLYVQASASYQARGGHHTMLYYVEGTTPFRDDPHECTPEDMGNVRFVGVGTADGVGITLAPGMALRIPRGARLYVQSHYVNSGTAALAARDYINLELLPRERVERIAGAFTEVDLGLDLPARTRTRRVIDCTFPAEMNIPWAIPHMHEYGAHFRLELVSGTNTRVLYDSDWTAALRDHFPVVNFPQELHVTPQDHLRTICDFNNTTTHRMLWPEEMCATFLVFHPSNNGALLACDSRDGHFQP
jgi:hypothetical protein